MTTILRHGEERSDEAINGLPLQFEEQVAPPGVRRLDKRDFLFPRTSLQLLLATDRMVHRGVELEPHQPLATVATGETLDLPFAVLLGALGQV